MKCFLLKVLTIIILLTLFIGTTEFIARRDDSSRVGKQKKYLLENLDSIEGVIFGPSHLYRALFPKYLDYNVATLALPGSAINIDSYLYNYTNKLITPKFYVFDLSQAYLNSSKGNKFINKNKLDFYFSINGNQELKNSFFIRLPLKNYFTLKKEKSKFDKWGQNRVTKKNNFFRKCSFNDSILFNSLNSKKLLKLHNRDLNKKTYNKNISILKKIIRDCKDNNIKLILVSPPKYHLYNKNLNSELTLQREVFLKEVIDNKTVFFLNFETFKENKSEFFIDLNHLSTEGAKAFSIEFNKKLRTIL